MTQASSEEKVSAGASPFSKWNELVVDSAKQLFDKLYEYTSRDGEFAFRGQPNSKDSLRPVIDRVLDKGAISYRLNKEEETIHLFRADATVYLSSVERELVERDKVSALTVMRHYGVPTRLLDWTMSPWVAAYFASSKDFPIRPSDNGHDGAIWLFHHQVMQTRVNSAETRVFGRNASDVDYSVLGLSPEDGRDAVAFSIKSQPILVPVFNIAKNTRMIAQHGMFTFCFMHGTGHESVLEEYLELPNVENGMRIIIPSKMKKEVLRRLATMNITPATLFPGADGVGTAIYNRLCWL